MSEKIKDNYRLSETIEHLLLRYGLVLRKTSTPSKDLDICIPFISSRDYYVIRERQEPTGKWFGKKTKLVQWREAGGIEHNIVYQTVGLLSFNKTDGVIAYCYDNEIYDYISCLPTSNIEAIMQVRP